MGRLPRLLSHAFAVVPAVLVAFALAPQFVSASPSPSPSKALSYARGTECVAFVADVMAKEFGDLTFYWDGARGRNANTFVPRAKKAGLPVNYTPSVPSVMYEPAGRYGHVAIVREVFPDGSFKVEESNYSRGRKTTRVLTPSPRLQFIHPKPKETIVVANTDSDSIMVASMTLADMSDPMLSPQVPFSIPVPAPFPVDDGFIPVDRMEVTAPEPLPTPVIEPKSGRKVACTLTAYYSPLRGQRRYTTGSYAGDIRLNGRGTNGASGVQVFDGMIAAPKDLPFGTKVEIADLGTFEVQDRGGAIVRQGSSYRFDVWKGRGDAGLAAALKFGKKKNQTCIIYS